MFFSKFCVYYLRTTRRAKFVLFTEKKEVLLMQYWEFFKAILLIFFINNFRALR